MELIERCDLDDCSGWVCEFHSLRQVAQDYILQLEAELAQAMDALFPNGWGQDDAEELGSVVEGVCETMTTDAAELAQSRADNARLREACEKTAAIVIDGYDACDMPLNEAWRACVDALEANDDAH